MAAEQGARAQAAVHTGGLRLTIAGGSETGRRYRANFDVLALDPDRPVVAVADGMGGGRGSAVAGRTAVETLLRRLAGLPARPRPRQLRAAAGEVQRRVVAAGAGLAELTGCTLTALIGDGDEEEPGAWIVHIGDTRVYRLRGGVLELLTSDHTLAWLGLQYGWYPADSPAAEADRYRLLRYVGHPDQPEPDLLHLALRPGDVLCLCSDGLAEAVPYQRLAGTLTDSGPAAAVEALLAAALAAGGRDNATLAVVAVTAAGAGPVATSPG